MNSQIDFDADNKTFGFDEWEYLNFRFRSSSGINETIIDEFEKQNAELVSLKKVLEKTKKNYLESKRKIHGLEFQLEQTEKQLVAAKKELQLIEFVCFINDDTFVLPPNSLALRIRNSLVDIKKDLHARIQQWKCLAVDMLPLLEKKDKKTKPLKKRFHELFKRYAGVFFNPSVVIQ